VIASGWSESGAGQWRIDFVLWHCLEVVARAVLTTILQFTLLGRREMSSAIEEKVICTAQEKWNGQCKGRKFI